MDQKVTVEKLFENAEFVEKLQKAESKDDLQKLFAEYGVELSREEIDEIVSELEKFNSSDELDEENLESVAGGAITLAKLAGWCWKALKAGWNAGKKFYEWEQSLYR